MRLLKSSLLLLALAACSPAKQQPPLKSSSATADVQAFMGEPIRVGDAEVTVSGGTKRVKYDPASEKSVAIILEYSIKNVGTHPLDVSKVPFLRLVDDKGTIYNGDAGLTAIWTSSRPVSRKAVSDLNPGILETDAIAFEVSSDYFDGTKWVATPGDGVKIHLCERKAAVNGACVKSSKPPA